MFLAQEVQRAGRHCSAASALRPHFPSSQAGVRGMSWGSSACTSLSVSTAGFGHLHRVGAGRSPLGHFTTRFYTLCARSSLSSLVVGLPHRGLPATVSRTACSATKWADSGGGQLGARSLSCSPRSIVLAAFSTGGHSLRTAAHATSSAAQCMQVFARPSCPFGSGKHQGHRFISTSNRPRSGGSSRAQAASSSVLEAEAVRFEYDLDDAVELFDRWATTNTPVLRPPKLTSLTPYFVPFWVFEGQASMRLQEGGPATSIPLPEPAVQVYSGLMFRRSMMEVAKTPVHSAVPFTADLLNISGMPVELDIWHAYETLALQLAREASLQHVSSHNPEAAEVHVSLDTSRRVLMPVFIAEYDAYGNTFRVVINGATGAAFGLEQVLPLARLTSMVQRNAVVFAPILLALGRLVFVPAAYAAVLFGWVAFTISRNLHGLFLVRLQRRSFKEWQQIRHAEQRAQQFMSDTWQYSRGRKTESAGRAAGHAGWKRYNSRGDHTNTSHAHTPPPVSRDFDPTDYYALLGLEHKGPSATLSEIRSAFRRQLMIYHPDRVQQPGSNLDAETANARTRAIIDAYGVLRNKSKRAEYDRSLGHFRR